MMQRRRFRSISPSPARNGDATQDNKTKKDLQQDDISVSPSLPWQHLHVGGGDLSQSATRHNSSAVGSATVSVYQQEDDDHQQQQRSLSRSHISSYCVSPKAVSINRDDDEQQDGGGDESGKAFYPIDQLPEQFSDVRFIAEGGYARVFSATDLALTASTAANGPALRVAVKTMDFVCDAEDAARIESLAQYGDLAQLLAGQEYVPSHITSELRAHTALRDVSGTMPLLRVSVWCEPDAVVVDDDAQEHNEFRRCWVMLSLPLLEALHTRSFLGQPQQEQQLLPAVTQIATTLQKMHSRNWLHRDLSVTNIFAPKMAMSSSSSTTMIVGDFGLAACVSGRTAAAMHYTAPTTNACTTIWYRSPEIVADPETPYTFESDAWALGAVVTELTLGAPVFAGLTREEQLAAMQSGLPERSDSDFADSLLQQHCGSTTSSDTVRASIVHSAAEFLLQRDPAQRSVEKFIESLQAVRA